MASPRNRYHVWKMWGTSHQLVWSWWRFHWYDNLALGWRSPGVIDIGHLAIVLRRRAYAH